ncbi:MAG: RimK/LysX family protein [Actinomycetes bacterium]
MSTPLPVLGWKEQAALPELDIPRLRVKLDTGARSSALHVEDLEVVGTHELDGEELPILGFTVLHGPRSHPRSNRLTVPAAGLRRVRDTRARPEERPFIRTRVVVGPVDVVTDVTVTDRSGMNFLMLLGRRALAGRCTIDPGRGYVVSDLDTTVGH